MIYLGINRGVKAGSFNAPLIRNYARVGNAGLPYDEEVLVGYEGDFKAGRRNGPGKLTSSDGHVYEGEFLDDQLVEKK